MLREYFSTSHTLSLFLALFLIRSSDFSRSLAHIFLLSPNREYLPKDFIFLVFCVYFTYFFITDVLTCSPLKISFFVAAHSDLYVYSILLLFVTPLNIKLRITALNSRFFNYLLYTQRGHACV